MARQRKYSKGDRIGHLVATGRFEAHNFRSSYEVICDCGRITSKMGHNLGRHTNSCALAGCPYSGNEKHGKTLVSEKHRSGRKKCSKEYLVWRSIKAACYGENTKAYQTTGARGIIMLPEWKNSFSAFNKDMGDAPGPKHRFSRISHDGDFWPNNCYWRPPKGWKFT